MGPGAVKGEVGCLAWITVFIVLIDLTVGILNVLKVRVGGFGSFTSENI